MKAVRLEKFGDPAEVLHLADAPVPDPGPGQVRVKLLMSPIHNHDLAIVRGVYGYKPPLPAIPGTEAVGLVDALGSGVTNLAIGQRVSAGGVQSAWAEFFLAKAATAVPIPPVIPDEVACQLLAMPLSAYMLIEDLQIGKGDWIIQNAAAGAVGRMIDTLAHERGINVVNLVRRPEGVRALEAAGAKNVLATDTPGWFKEVPKLTAGAPVARAIDSVGGKGANDLMDALGVEGQLVSFGAMSNEPLMIDVRNILFKEIVVKGFWGSKRAERTSPADTLRMIGDLLRLASLGRLPLKVEARFPLAEAGKAAAASGKPGRAGKIALIPG